MRANKIFHLIFLATLLGVFNVYADDIVTIGVPPRNSSSNFLDASDPTAQMLRQAVTPSLTRVGSKTGSPFRLWLASSLQVGANLTSVSLQIRPESTFSNGERVAASDVEYSLGRCKKVAGQLPFIQTISPRVKRLPYDAPPYAFYEEWVDLATSLTPEEAKGLPLLLASCPIIEKRSSLIFGNEVGIGTNVVGAGPFVIASGRQNQEFTLVLRPRGEATSGGAAKLVLKSYDKIDQELSALRVGNLDAMVVESSNMAILENIRGDETLLDQDCDGFHLIIHRGLTLSCTPWSDFDRIRYSFEKRAGETAGSGDTK